MSVIVVTHGGHKKHFDHKHIENTEEQLSELPYSRSAFKIMNAQKFVDYVKKHGYHFSNKLAEWASAAMVNADGTNHSWSVKQVETVLENYGGKSVYGKCTIGDLTYLANMAYADFYPDVCKDETACLKYAIKVAKDPDGYEGMVFFRWLSDIIGKEMTDIDWD